MVVNEPSTVGQAHEKAFLPTRLEAIGFLSAGALILLCGKVSTLLLSAPDVFEVKESFLDVVFDLSTRDITNRLSSSLGWFAAGSLAYLVLWSLIVFITDFYNDIVISSSFVHPKSFHQSTYWLAIIGRALLRLASGIILLFLIFLAIKVVPYWYGAGAALGGGLSVRNNVTLVLGCIIGSALILYLAMIGLRLLFLKRRLF